MRFGIFDEDLFDLVVAEALNKAEPSLSFVMTLSNHPPFELPTGYEKPPLFNIPTEGFWEGGDLERLQKRLAAYAYSDRAVKHFFEKAKKSPFYDETLFILTSDHSHNLTTRVDTTKKYIRKRLPFSLHGSILKDAGRNLNKRASHSQLTPTIVSLIEETPIISWHCSMLDSRCKDDLLLSFYFNCYRKTCKIGDSILQVTNDLMFTPCSSQTCREEIKKLEYYHEAYTKTGQQYFFEYKD
jgi:hypothetical protein